MTNRGSDHNVGLNRKEHIMWVPPSDSDTPEIDNVQSEVRQNLIQLLNGDLDFHGEASTYSSHNFHSFPAKFPPQIPRLFINRLTKPGDVVLDPMVGSGTTAVEAVLAGRTAVGFDIDPLALLLSKVKVTPLDSSKVSQIGNTLLTKARQAIQQPQKLYKQLEGKWDTKTRAFVDYWFTKETQAELLALINGIEAIEDADIRDFFRLIFSSIIITKSGGVSLAFDLGHTRPHRAKVARTKSGELVLGHENAQSNSFRVKLLTKTLRSPLDEFEKRFHRNLASLPGITQGWGSANIQIGNAQQLPLLDDTVDLVVTSPPYISNAIDYMRAHKFSLVWFGHSISDLGEMRKNYIGGEATANFAFTKLPPTTTEVIQLVSKLDHKKGLAVRRYYSEMKRVLDEMHRVLKPGGSAVIVVGTSVIRGVDTEIATCLTELGEAAGFEMVARGVRNLDRNRRMLPAGSAIDRSSQIQQRMHQEDILGFYKP